MKEFLKWLVFAFGAAVAYFEPIHELLLVVVILYFADFLTGYGAYVYINHKAGFRSKRLRWSLVKLFIYLGILMLAYGIYDLMNVTLISFDYVVSIIMYGYIYIEGLSMVENLLKIWPEDKVLLFLHYILSIKFLKLVPKIAEQLKEKEEENV